jgi:hypothetical protein
MSCVSVFRSSVSRSLLATFCLGWALGFSSGAAANGAQLCYDMYSSDVYDSQDRYSLVQECLSAYATDQDSQPVNYTDASANQGNLDDYYQGTVDDFVNDLPTGEGQ